MKGDSKKQLVIIGLIMICGIGAAIGALVMRDENSQKAALKQNIEEVKVELPKTADENLSEIDNVLNDINSIENDIPEITLEEIK